MAHFTLGGDVRGAGKEGPGGGCRCDGRLLRGPAERSRPEGELHP